MKTSDYKKERTHLTSELKRIVRPYLRTSGYRERGTSRPLNLWVRRIASGDPAQEPFKLRGGFVVDTFFGFTPFGVIVDWFAGGLNTCAYEEMPIEDLYRLHQWVVRKFATPAASKARLTNNRTTSQAGQNAFAS